jgi:hypothetical protein
MAAFDWPEFWNSKVRAADYLNPQAARSILLIAFLRSRMVMAGRSKAEILSAIKAAFENRQLPDLESGAMAYMMSKSAYLTDEDDHNIPHLMFLTAVMDLRIGVLARRARRSCRPPIGSSRRRNHPK